MPPKKAPGKQATLGSFFAMPAGVKPPVPVKEERVASSPAVEAGSSPVTEQKEDLEATEVKKDDDVKLSDAESDVKPKKKATKRKVVDSSSESETATPKSPKTKRAKSSPKKQVNTTERSNTETTNDSIDSAISVSKAAAKEDAATPEAESEVSDKEADVPDAVAKKAAEEIKAFKPAEKTKDWEKEGVPYAALCATFEKIESTTKRLEILSYTSKFFRTVIAASPGSLLQVVYLTINRIAPDYEGVELGIGEGLLIKAISEATGRSIAQVKQDYQETGDLGTVAQRSKGMQPTMFKPKPLTVPSVFSNLKEIATTSGQSSQAKKIGIIKKLLSSCQGNEAKYLIRSLEGKLRIRLAEKTVLTALAQAVIASEADKKGKIAKTEDIVKGEDTLKTVFSNLPSYDIIVPELLKNGVNGLQNRCTLTPGVPLKPMLAKPTKAITEVLDRFENQKFTCEYKYDGERAQIHLTPDGKSKVYSRNSEDMSGRYPDILSRLGRVVNDATTSFVLDCEAVAWDVQEKKILPFQVLSTRKRKDVQEADVKIKVCVFAFDLLYLNGESLLTKSLSERRTKMHEAFQEVEGEFLFAKWMDGQSIEEIQVFLDESVKDSCEGLMVKMLEGPESGYEPSKRSRNWLKIKKDYLAGVGDSLDLVVLGAYHGRGKRTNVYGAFLLGCYNPEAEQWESICKVGTGFSEEDLENHHKVLKEHVIVKPKGYYSVADGGPNKPDVWFEPRVVWELLTADLSLSPTYKAAIGMVNADKGISLRFPRYLRVRDDKKPEEATTSEQVAEMYRAQASTQKASGGGAGGVDDDFEY
ncbi:ATP-dependent DNA ligase Cdc17 [Saitoella coloradoensis]